MFGFEKLEAWRLAVEYVDAVYEATEAFLRDERFGLTNHLCRTSVSTSANIAEGAGRGGKEFGRFIGIAYSSLMETVSQLLVARRRSYLKENTFNALYQVADRLARILSGLRNSVDTRR